MNWNETSYYSQIISLSRFEKRIGAYRRSDNRTTHAVMFTYAGPWPKNKLTGVFKIEFK